jgi:outer membrane protein assembly factor BamB
VALSGERLYVGDIDGKFYCFDLQGNEQWQFTASAEVSASANFHKGNVLFGSQDTTLYCLNAGSGQLVWKHAIDDQIRCCPTVVQDRAFVAGCDSRLHIIDLNAGQGIATVDIHAPTGVTPAVLGKHVYFGTEGGIVFCVDWQQAKVIWTFEDERGREIRSSPAVNDQMLVIGSRSKSVYGIDLQTGKEVWTFACKRAVDSSPVIVGSRVVVGASDGRLYALDMKTGEPRWLMETGGGFTGSPAVAANRLLIANDDGVLYCFG